MMLIDPKNSLLLVVDIQEKLVPTIHQADILVSNCKWLIEIASLLDIPVVTSEQYPKGLGHTVPELRAALPGVRLEKTHFSCMASPPCQQAINALGKRQLIVTGMETHVCVLQTALQSLQQGFDTFVVSDCVSSRRPEDRDCGLARMRASGVHIVNREMVAFEWMQEAGTDTFRHISKNFLR